MYTTYCDLPTMSQLTRFYSTKSMQDTLASLIHVLMCANYGADDSRPETRALLRRMVHFFHRGLVEHVDMPDAQAAHLPSLEELENGFVAVEEVMSLLSLCALIFFAKALDPRSYMAPNQHGDTLTNIQMDALKHLHITAIPRAERKELCTARGVCISLIDWFRSTFSVLDTAEGRQVDLPSIYFVELAKTIMRYKYLADMEKLHFKGCFTMENLEKELIDAFDSDKPCHQQWQSSEGWMKDELRRSLQDIDDTMGDQDAEGEPDEELAGLRRQVPPRWLEDSLLLENPERFQITRVKDGTNVRRSSGSMLSDSVVNTKNWQKMGEVKSDVLYFDLMVENDEVNAREARRQVFSHSGRTKAP